MDKSSLLKTFNNHFVEFVDDIQKAFPDNTDIMTAKNALVSMRKINPRIIISGYKDSVVGPYREQILLGDIDFFIYKDYNADIKELKYKSSISDIIDGFRKPVKNMTESDQSKVIQYMQNLLKLSDMYYS